MEEFLSLYLFVVPLVILWAVALWDNWKRTSRSVGAKTAWSAVILLLPVVGIAIYFASRPVPPPAGQIRDREDTTSAIVDELQALTAAHDRGDVSDEEYAAGKMRLFDPGGTGAHST
jgi:hypothetical protein